MQQSAIIVVTEKLNEAIDEPEAILAESQEMTKPPYEFHQ